MSSRDPSPDLSSVLPSLYRIADSFRIPGMDRDDRRQEAVLIALDALRNGTEVGHLRTVVRTKLISLQEKMNRRESSGDDEFREPVDPAPGPVQQAQTNELRERCRNVLTARQFSVVECLFFDGLTAEQTADQLGINAQAVADARWAALKKIRFLLDENDYSPV